MRTNPMKKNKKQKAKPAARSLEQVIALKQQIIERAKGFLVSGVQTSMQWADHELAMGRLTPEQHQQQVDRAREEMNRIAQY
ncbi:hypothetical protein GCM10027299_03320 [Larkinella ripae]